MYVICRRVLAPKSCLLSRLIFIQFRLQPSGHDVNRARFVMIVVCVNSLYIFDSKQIGLKLLMSFLFHFLKNITTFASFHVLGIRRSVMHFVYSLVSCFAMVSSPAFSVSMLT